MTFSASTKLASLPARSLEIAIRRGLSASGTSRVRSIARASFALVRLVFVRIAPVRLASLRSAPARRASSRLAFARVAFVRIAPLRFASRRSASVRERPERSAPLRSAPAECRSAGLEQSAPLGFVQATPDAMRLTDLEGVLEALVADVAHGSDPLGACLAFESVRLAFELWRREEDLRLWPAAGCLHLPHL